MVATPLALAVNGRERLLQDLVAFRRPDEQTSRLGTVAVVGLGYVGLPTALALRRGAERVVGLDIDERRLGAVAEGDVDLNDDDRQVLGAALEGGHLQLTADDAVLGAADVVIICVPTPVLPDRTPIFARSRPHAAASCGRPGRDRRSF